MHAGAYIQYSIASVSIQIKWRTKMFKLQNCMHHAKYMISSDQFVCSDQFFQIIALKTQYSKISRAFDYKKKSRQPAEERLQSLHCADCHGESYYILHIFLHVYFAYCRGGTFYISYIYVVYEIYVSPFCSIINHLESLCIWNCQDEKMLRKM